MNLSVVMSRAKEGGWESIVVSLLREGECVSKEGWTILNIESIQVQNLIVGIYI